MMTSSVDAPNPAPEKSNPARRVRCLLDPIDRSSEILFALIMVLAITGSISAAEARREDIRTMLIGALGCNIAWGIVDAVIFLMAGITERGRGLRMLREVRSASDAVEAHRVIVAVLPPVIASVMDSASVESLRLRLGE